MFKKLILQFNKDHLYRNSLYLMGSTVVLAGFGFFFWIIAAREFSTQEVGIATTLISAVSLIGSFALLGLNVALNRFLPKSTERNEMISSTGIIIMVASAITAVVFLVGIGFFSPKLSFLTSNLIYISSFIFFVIVLALNTILDSVYMAYRASGNILFKNTILSVLKVIFIYTFVSLGTYGIFSSFTTAMTISFFMSLGILIFKYGFRLELKIRTEIIRKMAKFSIGNYIAGFFQQAPMLVLPLIIINSLSATAAAYYYIDTMIVNLLVTIPLATSQALFTEGSHDESLVRHHIIKASKITFLFLIPSVLIIFFFGDFILQFFGKSYEIDAFRFLQVVSISAIFIPFALFGNSILRVQQKIKQLIILNVVSCSIILGFSYSFMSNGLVGLGWGWVLGQFIVALIYLVVMYKYVFR